ncbi:hypothetical protein BGZ83_009955 [Gryganskiella cystojenkinii]|nr:hypothetical protein BGZ83_009955 [Gryganskiella cystojenkinii]
MAMAMAQRDLDRSYSSDTSTTTSVDQQQQHQEQRTSSTIITNKNRSGSGSSSGGSELVNSLAHLRLYNDFNDTTFYDGDIRDGGGSNSNNNLDDPDIDFYNFNGDQTSSSDDNNNSMTNKDPEDGPILTRLLSSQDLFPIILAELDTWSLLQLTSISARYRREILMPAIPNLCRLNIFFRTKTVICPMEQFEPLKDFMVKYRSFKPLHIHFTYSEQSSLMTLKPEISAPIYNSKTDPLFSHPSTSPLSTSHLLGVNQSISINLTSTTNSLYQLHHPLSTAQQQQLIHGQQLAHQPQEQQVQGQEMGRQQQSQQLQLEQQEFSTQNNRLLRQQNEQDHEQKPREQQRQQQPHSTTARPDQKEQQQSLSHTQHKIDQPENAGGSSNMAGSSSISKGETTMAQKQQHASFQHQQASTAQEEKGTKIDEDDKTSIEKTTTTTQKDLIPKSGLTAAIHATGIAATVPLNSNKSAESEVISLTENSTPSITTTSTATTSTSTSSTAATVEPVTVPITVVPQYGSRYVDYYGIDNAIGFGGGSNNSIQSRSHPNSNDHHHGHHHQLSTSDAIPIFSTYSSYPSSSPLSASDHQHHGFELSYWQKFALNELFMRILPFLKTLTIGRTDKPFSRQERDGVFWVNHSRTRTVPIEISAHSSSISNNISNTNSSPAPSSPVIAGSNLMGGHNHTHTSNGSRTGSSNGESELYMGVCFFLARCFNVMHDMPDTALESVVWMDVTANDVVLLNKMVELRDIMVDERYWKRGYWAIDYPATASTESSVSQSNSNSNSNSNSHSKSTSSTSSSAAPSPRLGRLTTANDSTRTTLEESDEFDSEGHPDEEEERGPGGSDWDGFYFLMNIDQCTKARPPVQAYEYLRAKVVEATNVPKAYKIQRRKGKGKKIITPGLTALAKDIQHLGP